MVVSRLPGSESLSVPLTLRGRLAENSGRVRRSVICELVSVHFGIQVAIWKCQQLKQEMKPTREPRISFVFMAMTRAETNKNPTLRVWVDIFGQMSTSLASENYHVSENPNLKEASLMHITEAINARVHMSDAL